MWLVFVLLILIIIRIGLFFSKTKISIKYINISEKNFDVDARISLYIFYKFKILTIKCNEVGIKVGPILITYEKIIKSINTEEFVKKTFKPISFYKIKNLNLFVEKMHVDCKIGTENLFITVGIVTVISAFLGIMLERELIKKENKTKTERKMEIYQYRIMPAFGENILLFNGDFAISFKTRRIGIFLSPKEHTKFKILVGG